MELGSISWEAHAFRTWSKNICKKKFEFPRRESNPDPRNENPIS